MATAASGSKVLLKAGRGAAQESHVCPRGQESKAFPADHRPPAGFSSRFIGQSWVSDLCILTLHPITSEDGGIALSQQIIINVQESE